MCLSYLLRKPLNLGFLIKEIEVCLHVEVDYSVAKRRHTALSCKVYNEA